MPIKENKVCGIKVKELAPMISILSSLHHAVSEKDWESIKQVIPMAVENKNSEAIKDAITETLFAIISGIPLNRSEK